jgi:hypothetical protein
MIAERTKMKAFAFQRKDSLFRLESGKRIGVLIDKRNRIR